MENNEQIHDKLIDIELAKSDIKNSKVKKYIPAVVLMATAYYSMFFCVGIAIGYMGSRIFSKYLLEKGKVDPIYIDCGKWKIHFHHWIMGAIFLLAVWFLDKYYLPALFVGVISGIIAHDIYDYNDWHKVLVKNENYKPEAK